MTALHDAYHRETDADGFTSWVAGEVLIEPELLALDPAIVRWRLAATWPKDHPTEGELVPYVDARRVADRLDKIDPAWSTTLMADPTGKGIIRGLTLRGVTRWDVGQTSQIEGFKGAASDSLKRCAFLFGIFRELYDLPKIVTLVDERKRRKGGNPRLVDGAWKPPRGGRIREDPGSIEERHAENERPAARPAAAPVADSATTSRRGKTIRRIKDLVDELDGLRSRAANRYSVRAHTVREYGVEDLVDFYNRATIEALDELGAYVASKITETRAGIEREAAGAQADVEDVSQDPEPPRRAEEMSDDEAIAAGAALARAAGSRPARPRQTRRPRR